MKVTQTFSEQVKEELSRYKYDEAAMKAILSSFLTNNLTMSITRDKEAWEIRTQLNSTIRLIDNFLCQLYDITRKVSYTAIQKINNRRIYKLSLEGNFEQINSDLQLNETYPKQILNNSINVRAYLAGAFLGGGSISSVEKSNYHLEIRSSKLHYLRVIQKLLLSFNISITLLKRKNNYALYIKKAANVSDFLKIIGANDAMMQLEEVIISRDYYNNVQKLNNLDIANLKKTSAAGQVQVMMINKIRNSKLFKEQPDKFKFYCSLKLQNPEASLTEMVHIFQEKYQINMTRTGINHYVLKIKKIFRAI